MQKYPPRVGAHSRLASWIAITWGNSSASLNLSRIAYSLLLVSPLVFWLTRQRGIIARAGVTRVRAVGRFFPRADAVRLVLGNFEVKK